MRLPVYKGAATCMVAPADSVILAAFIARGDADGVDLTPLLTSQMLVQVLRQALTACPVPPPSRPGIRFFSAIGRCLSDEHCQSVARRATGIDGGQGVCGGGSYLAHPPADRRWVCQLHAEPNGTSAVFDCPGPPLPPPPPPPPRRKRKLDPPGSQPPVRPGDWRFRLPTIAAVVVVVSTVIVLALPWFKHQPVEQIGDSGEPVSKQVSVENLVHPLPVQLPEATPSIPARTTIPKPLPGQTAAPADNSQQRRSAIRNGQPATLPDVRDEDRPTAHQTDSTSPASLWVTILPLGPVLLRAYGFSSRGGISDQRRESRNCSFRRIRTGSGR